jgi:hypothetical protein
MFVDAPVGDSQVDDIDAVARERSGVPRRSGLKGCCCAAGMGGVAIGGWEMMRVGKDHRRCPSYGSWRRGTTVESEFSGQDLGLHSVELHS